MSTTTASAQRRWCAHKVTPAQIQTVWAALAVNALLAAAFVVDLGSAVFALGAAVLGAPPAILLALRDRPRAFRTLALGLAVVYLAGGLVLFLAGGLAYVLTSVLLFGAAVSGRDAPRRAPRAVSPGRARWQLGLVIVAVAIVVALLDG